MVLKVSFLVVELNLRNFKPFYKSYTAIPFPKYLYGELGICDYICKWVVLIFFQNFGGGNFVLYFHCETCTLMVVICTITFFDVHVVLWLSSGLYLLHSQSIFNVDR